MDATTPNRSLIGRMIRAAKLDADVYEEVEHDREATRQAAMVVVLTSIAGGIGAGVAFGIRGLVLVIVASVLAWAAYAWITYFIGTRIFAGPETEADWGELARTLAFANSPRALLIFGVVPLLAGIVGLIVFVWIVVATVVALRAALDFSTGRAIATGLVGFIIYGIIGALFAVLLA